ncbi:Uncharacterised protein [Vibrio cholerae]|nr:Uncharacterised protein [Vibrio cholerae]
MRSRISATVSLIEATSIGLPRKLMRFNRLFLIGNS